MVYVMVNTPTRQTDDIQMQKIFAYCERGLDPSFWAEPFNAVSNVAFLAAAAIAGGSWLRMGPDRREPAVGWLIGLVAVIGIGSFLFHTFANRWAAIADAAPIGIFMLAYTGYALRVFLGLPAAAAAAGVVFFVALMGAASAAPCPMELRALVKGTACLNGSIGYLPALAMLLAIGIAASIRTHVSGPYLLAAAAVFAVSLSLRSLDRELCEATVVLGRERGTHALWHVLNATTLLLLLNAAVAQRRRQADIDPQSPC